MTDILLRLMATSDPLFSSLRQVPQKKVKMPSEETLQLFILLDDSVISEAEDSEATFSDDSDSTSSSKI